MNELLAEVRGLRAEINQAAQAGMRAQLLGMRLQLQEQRIAVVSRQLTDVQERLRGNERARGPLAAGLKMFADQTKETSDKAGLDIVFGPLKSQLEELDKSDQQLRAEEADLSRLLAQEQSRWTSFNAQIEELERASAAKNVK
jgi:hypothetical protein